MELLRAKVRVTSQSKRAPIGPGQFIMLKAPDELVSATVSVDAPSHYLQLKDGEEVVIIIEKPIEQ